MRILGFVDVHGNTSALKKVIEKAKKADIIICAGDLSIFQEGLDILLSKLSRTKKLVLVIPGNHEDEQLLADMCSVFNNVLYMHERSYHFGKYVFFGYGGGGFSQNDERLERLTKRFKKHLKKSDKVILFTHAPPYRTKLDKIGRDYVGNESVNKFVKLIKPKLLICGHIHETAGKSDKIGSTKIINPGPEGRLIEI